MDFSPLPESFSSTREQLHQLAEHVLAAARYQREGRIGLRSTPAGFGTPPNSEWQVRVEGTELIVNDKREQITTLANAAQFVGCDLGAPENVYKPTTPLTPDVLLEIDAESSRRLGSWYAFADLVLQRLRSSDDASEIQLWPEHFDIAFEQGSEQDGKRIGFGGSPGDENYTQPYLYAVPWRAQPDQPLWNADGFHGHVITFDELAQADPVDFVLDRFRDVSSVV